MTQRQAQLVDVGDAASLDHGDVRIVEVRGREVGVVRWHEQIYAVRNLCPHATAPLCAGTIEQFIDRASLVERDGERDGKLVISCPWHRWEFDLETGRALAHPKMRVKTYVVVVQNGRIMVEVA